MPAAKSGIKVTASDALEFEPVSAPRQGSGRGLRFVMWLVVLGVGGAGWYFYGDRVIRLVGDSASAVPILRAEAGPIKVRPENPGGLDIPDRDKLVYSRIQGDGGTDADSGIERLLPPPETPLPKPEPAVTEQVSAPSAPAVEPVIAAKPAPEQVAALAPPPEPEATMPQVTRTTSIPLPQAKPKPSARVPSENDVAALQPPAKVQPAAVSPAAETPMPVAEPAPVPPPPPAAPSTPVEAAPVPVKLEPGAAPVKAPVAASPATTVAKATTAAAKATTRSTYRVQLAAARSPEAVEQEWVRLRKKHLDLLGNLGLGITKADLGIDKGVFYRLRIGPIANERAARKLCADLAKRKVGCLIIKPSG